MLLSVVALGQEAHVKGSFLEHGKVWQCHYDVAVGDITYVTTHNGNDHCEKALPTGFDTQVVDVNKKHIKIINTKGKEMTLDIVGTKE